jgi:non-canonical purine NTP pyrophosphatase (RdgB/HAM1 family)
MELLIATTNPGKVREFREMLGHAGVSFSDLSAHPGTAAVEETGHTFRANACLKAAHYARLFKTYAVADDSGLEVDALGGAPGVHSARWAEMNRAGKGDADNNALLLRQLEDVADERRTARFVCVLALADPDGRILVTARDTVEGRVIREARGANGFGYDPLFFIDEMGRTTAELAAEQKHAISHRGKALRHLRGIMERLGL